MNQKKGGLMTKVADRFIAPIAVGGAIGLASGFGHLYISVDHINKTRYTREMGAESDARDAAALSSIREQLGIVRGQVERLRQEVDTLEKDFHAHERSRSAHSGQ